MDWLQIYSSLTESERQELTHIMLYRIAHSPRRSTFRPIHILYPLTILQITLFILTITQLSITTFLIGNLLLAALAILPTLRTPKTSPLPTI